MPWKRRSCDFAAATYDRISDPADTYKRTVQIAMLVLTEARVCAVATRRLVLLHPELGFVGARLTGDGALLRLLREDDWATLPCVLCPILKLRKLCSIWKSSCEGPVCMFPVILLFFLFAARKKSDVLQEKHIFVNYTVLIINDLASQFGST